MLNFLLPTTALLAGVALLLLGSGLLNSLLALRGSAQGFSDAALGLITSGYFVGFLLGTFLAPGLIRRVGHVRAFALCAAGAACTALLHALFDAPIAWLLLRVGTGLSLVVLYVVIESWLNSIAPEGRRAQLFAVYMAINLGALAIAQQLLRLDAPTTATLPIVVGLLLSLALMPVSWTRLAAPETPHTPRLRLRDLHRRAPSAVAGAFLSGLAMGPFWGLLPLYGARIGLDAEGVGTLMTAAILGGAALQWPLGRWSDRGDRRAMLAGAAAFSAASALLLMLVASLGTGWLLLAIFLYGGFAFAAYPLAVAHLMDHVERDALLAATGTALLLHGIGAAIGPLLAGALMGGFGPTALPLYFAAVQGLLAAYVFLRRRAVPRLPRFTLRFRPMLRTSQVALELLPTEDTRAAGNGPESESESERRTSA
jgi:MFS family permease